MSKGSIMRIWRGGGGKCLKEEGVGNMKRLVLMVMLGLSYVGSGYGLTSDSVLLTVQPIFNLSVNISSTSGSFGYGSALPLRTSYTLCVGLISNDGNVTSGWQKSTGATATGTTLNWALITSGTPYTDQFRLLAVTTGVGLTPNFTSGGTGPDDRCLQGDHQGLLCVKSTYDDLGEGGTSGPKHATGETRDLWVSIMMPYDVTGGDAETITLSVKAVVK